MTIRANAKTVYACEWNPHAIEALRRNLCANSVADRCIVLEGDNRVTAPKVWQFYPALLHCFPRSCFHMSKLSLRGLITRHFSLDDNLIYSIVLGCPHL